MNGNNVEA